MFSINRERFITYKKLGHKGEFSVTSKNGNKKEKEIDWNYSRLKLPLSSNAHAHKFLEKTPCNESKYIWVCINGEALKLNLHSASVDELEKAAVWAFPSYRAYCLDYLSFPLDKVRKSSLN